MICFIPVKDQYLLRNITKKSCICLGGYSTRIEVTECMLVPHTILTLMFGSSSSSVLYRVSTTGPINDTEKLFYFSTAVRVNRKHDA
jgi:hypothetical protein